MDARKGVLGGLIGNDDGVLKAYNRDGDMIAGTRADSNVVQRQGLATGMQVGDSAHRDDGSSWPDNGVAGVLWWAKDTGGPIPIIGHVVSGKKGAKLLPGPSTKVTGFSAMSHMPERGQAKSDNQHEAVVKAPRRASE